MYFLTILSTQQNQLNFKAAPKKFFKIKGDKIIELNQKLSPKRQEMMLKEKSVIELVLKGFKQYEIAEILKIPKNTINKIAKKYDAFQNMIKLRNKDIINELVNKGTSRRELAEKYGLDVRRVNVIAEKNNAFKKHIEQRDAKIIEMLKAGKMPIEIAFRLRISDSTVRRTGQKYGILEKRGYKK